jgi:NAD-dependent deacetylase
MEVIGVEENIETLTQQCAEALSKSRKVVLLSGAGMSTNAGIPDFRGPNGVYKRKMKTDPELIFDIDYFRQNPKFFYEFHREFLHTINTIRPTFSHHFFAELEKKGVLKGIITQNIDALHQKAGSKKVFEIHGSTWESFCTHCGQRYDYDLSYEKTFKEEVPHCDKCGGIIKPDIVFFGENVKYLYECQALVEDADLLFVVGSSLTVTPAAFLPSMCHGKIVIVNKGEISTSYISPRRLFIRADCDIDEFFKALDKELNHR